MEACFDRVLRAGASFSSLWRPNTVVQLIETGKNPHTVIKLQLAVVVFEQQAHECMLFGALTSCRSLPSGFVELR